MQKLLILTILIVSAISCGFKPEKDEAQKTIAAYYQAIEKKDFEKAMAYYDPEFFEKSKKQDWKAFLIKLSPKLGDLRKWEVINWRMNKMMGTKLRSRVIIVCKSQYSNYDAEETFTLVSSKNSSQYQILGHDIASKVFNNK